MFLNLRKISNLTHECSGACDREYLDRSAKVIFRLFILSWSKTSPQAWLLVKEFLLIFRAISKNTTDQKTWWGWKMSIIETFWSVLMLFSFLNSFLLDVVQHHFKVIHSFTDWPSPSYMLRPWTFRFILTCKEIKPWRNPNKYLNFNLESAQWITIPALCRQMKVPVEMPITRNTMQNSYLKWGLPALDIDSKCLELDIKYQTSPIY